MTTDIGCVPGGAARLVAGSSPSPMANAIAQAATSGRREKGEHHADELARRASPIERGRIEIVLGKRSQKWPENQERVRQRP